MRQVITFKTIKFTLRLVSEAQNLAACISMGVDTRGALGAEAPLPPDFQVLHYALYIDMAKIVELRPKLKAMIVA